jgi:hypothetical protein
LRFLGIQFSRFIEVKVRVSSNQIFEVSKFQDSKIAMFQYFKVAWFRLGGFKA